MYLEKSARVSREVWYFIIDSVEYFSKIVFCMRDNTTYIIFQHEKKLQVKKTKKKTNFAYFSKPSFGRQKPDFFLVPENGSADRAENFCAHISTKLEWVFFFLLNPVFIKLYGFYKICKIPKLKVFDIVYSILLFLTYRIYVLQNKKNISTPIWWKYLQKSFHLDRSNHFWRNREKTFGQI